MILICTQAQIHQPLYYYDSLHHILFSSKRRWCFKKSFSYWNKYVTHFPLRAHTRTMEAQPPTHVVCAIVYEIYQCACGCVCIRISCFLLRHCCHSVLFYSIKFTMLSHVCASSTVECENRCELLCHGGFIPFLVINSDLLYRMTWGETSAPKPGLKHDDLRFLPLALSLSIAHKKSNVALSIYIFLFICLFVCCCCWLFGLFCPPPTTIWNSVCDVGIWMYGYVCVFVQESAQVSRFSEH